MANIDNVMQMRDAYPLLYVKDKVRSSQQQIMKDQIQRKVKSRPEVETYSKV